MFVSVTGMFLGCLPCNEKKNWDDNINFLYSTIYSCRGKLSSSALLNKEYQATTHQMKSQYENVCIQNTVFNCFSALKNDENRM